MKKIFSIFLCLCLILGVGVSFVGCGKNYTPEEISTYYTQIKEADATKQFFSGNELVVDFSTVSPEVASDIMDPNEPAYILSQVYAPLLEASTKMITYKLQTNTLQLLIADFTQEAKNEMYLNLQALDTSLQELATVKDIFEKTDGTLRFTKLLTAYNNVLEKSFAFSETFAENYYINGIGYRDYSNPEQKIADSDCKEMLYYNNMLLGKIIFNFSVKEYQPENPLQPISTWYDTDTYMTTYLADYIDVCNKIHARDNSELLTPNLNASPDELKTRLQQMQTNLVSFKENTTVFYDAMANFNFQKYFKQTNKATYLEGCSQFEQSYFNVCNNFLNQRFSSRLLELDSLLTTYVDLCN